MTGCDRLRSKSKDGVRENVMGPGTRSKAAPLTFPRSLEIFEEMEKAKGGTLEIDDFQGPPKVRRKVCHPKSENFRFRESWRYGDRDQGPGPGPSPGRRKIAGVFLQTPSTKILERDRDQVPSKKNCWCFSSDPLDENFVLFLVRNPL